MAAHVNMYIWYNVIQSNICRFLTETVKKNLYAIP